MHKLSKIKFTVPGIYVSYIPHREQVLASEAKFTPSNIEELKITIPNTSISQKISALIFITMENNCVKFEQI